MNLNTKKDEMREYESPACICLSLQAVGSFLVGSPFSGTDPENFDIVNDDDHWM